MTNSEQVLDVCIVGSGPAGLQAGYFFKKKGVSFRILERSSAVSAFFRTFPRHRTFISINKVHTGLSNTDTRLRHDWNSLLNDEGLNFGDWSKKYFPNADDFVDYAETFAQQLSNDIECDSDVAEISKDDGVFSVLCTNGEIHKARNVIVATGVSQPWDPGIEGFGLVDNYFDFDVDPALYENKRVLIMGKGNSAFETADSLIEHAASIHVVSPNPIKFAWQTHFVGHLRAVNNNFLDTYQLKSQNAVIDAKVHKIEQTNGEYTVHANMNAAEDHDIVLTYDKVIACTGFQFDNSIFASDIRPQLRHFDKFPAMTAQWESETVDGLFFAGTIMQSRDYKKTMSGFVHGFRHNVKCLAEFITSRVQNTPYPTVETPLKDLPASIIERVSTSSGIFLQPGFLADVVMLDGDRAGQTYQEVPVEWALEAPGIADCDFLTVTLEYGDFGGDTLHVKRSHNVYGDHPDAFIHPVLRYYKAGKLMDAMHLSDHLDADWRPRSNRDANSATVLRITFKDAGKTLPPDEVAMRQTISFLQRNGLLDETHVTDSVSTAAE
ncbi:MAG: NAD(P)-binding domain-containing protein [Sulfitobacter sp.]